jgi:hypothetical protein
LFQRSFFLQTAFGTDAGDFGAGNGRARFGFGDCPGPVNLTVFVRVPFAKFNPQFAAVIARTGMHYDYPIPV